MHDLRSSHDPNQGIGTNGANGFAYRVVEQTLYQRGSHNNPKSVTPVKASSGGNMIVVMGGKNSQMINN
jgi:hypothetical protein